VSLMNLPEQSVLALFYEISLSNLCIQGHIEDVTITADYQGRKLGLRMMQALDYISEQVGSYKV
jgi:hypothetical protein